MDQVYRDYGYTPVYNHDRDTQLRGLDVTLTMNGKTYLVDEKAAITRLDGELKTFAFELYTSNNKDNIGWFVNKNCINDCYSLIYLTSNSNNIKEINRIECILLNKEKIFNIIIKELYKRNIHFNNIINIFDSVKLSPNGKKYIYLNKYMKIVYSLNVIPERPINVIVDKGFLLDLSDDILVEEYK